MHSIPCGSKHSVEVLGYVCLCGNLCAGHLGHSGGVQHEEGSSVTVSNVQQGGQQDPGVLSSVTATRQRDEHRLRGGPFRVKPG